MNDYITRGQKAFTQLTVETQTDPRNGGVTTITGVAHSDSTTPFTVPNDLYTYAVSLRSQGWIVIVKNTGKGNQWSLTATFNADLLLDPTDTWIPEPIWEVEPHELEKNILECTNRPFIASLSSETKAAIELAIKECIPSPQLTTPADIAQLANAKIAYNLKVQGVEGFSIFTQSVKRTLVASNRYDPTWSSQYDDMILSKDFLVSTYNVPAIKAGLLYDTDTSIQTDANGIATFEGFRQMPVAAVSVPPNKTQYTQTWVYNKWSAGPNGGYDVAG